MSDRRRASPPAPDEKPEPPKALAALPYIASRWLIERLQRHQRIQPRDTFRLLNVVREPRLHVEPRDWGTGFLHASEDERPPLPELINDLREVAPQALLRDLFRPESDFELRLERQTTRDTAGLDAIREARAARVREPLPRIEFGLTLIKSEQARRRKFVNDRWRPITPDDQRNLEAEASDRARARLGLR